MQDATSEYHELPSSGIVNLRIEDCQISSKAVSVLKHFFSKNQLIETLVISKVEFENSIQDFREIIKGIQYNMKLRKIGLTAMLFDEE